MEDKKTSETLQEGFVPCGRTPKEANSVLSSTLNEKWTSDHDVSHVEIDSELGKTMIRESSMDEGIAGNDQMNNNETVGSNGSSIKDNDMPVWEGDLKCSTNGRIQEGKVEETMERCDDELHCPEPGSPTMIEVSGSGINLFVEVFGPLEGISESNHNPSGKEEHVSADGDSNKECLPEENGVLSFCVKSDSAKNGEEVSGDGVSNKECSPKKNGALSFCVKSESAKNGEEGVGEQEYTFGVSDLVWVKTRSQLWWPGIVSEPLNAENNGTKTEKRANFLVKYFGNANFVWSNNLELKPFIEYFDQMSRQISSRNFVGSVEKALCEIGQRVKLKMTCRCFSKESQAPAVQLPLKSKKSSPVSLDDKHKTNALSLSQFEPAGFVARIRYLAQAVHAPGKIELTVMKNRLSAFYCSIGHHELPLQLVRSSSDVAQNVQDGPIPVLMDADHNNISGRAKSCLKTRDDDHYALRRGKRNCSGDAGRVHDDKINSSSKTSESRERKKSKYLSYPYVDVNRGLNAKSTLEKEAEDPIHNSSISKKSAPRGRCNGMASQKRVSRKPSKGHHIDSDAKNVNACSAKLLAELCSMARDCFYISGSKNSDSLKRFYTSFRNFAFLDVDKSGNVSRHQQEPDGEKCIPKSSIEAEVLSEGFKEVKTSKKERVNRESGKKTVEKVVNDQVSETSDQQVKGNGRRRGAKKKKKHITSASLQSTSNCSGTDKKDNPDVSCVISFQQTCSDVAKNETFPGKIEEFAQQSTSNCVGTDKMDNPDSSSVISSQQTCLDVARNELSPEKRDGCAQQSTSSDVPKSKTAPEKTEGSGPVLPQTNTVSQLPDLNGNHPSESVEQTSFVGPAADLSKLLTNQGMEGLVARNATGQHTAFASVPSLKDKSTTLLQNILKLDYPPVKGAHLCQKAEFATGEPEPNVTSNTRIISFVQPSLQMGPLPPMGKPERKERKRKQKTQQVASDIPDLNGNVLDTSSLGNGNTLLEGIKISTDGMPKQKRRRKSANAESGSNGKINEDLGGSLLLNFVSGSNLPSKEMLVAKFSRFGLLKESEIQVINDSSVQIVYERSSDAKFAFRSLEKSNPFGEALVNFKLHCTPAASNAKPRKRNFQMPQPFSPVDPRKNVAKPGEAPDLAVIRQNVEMMKLTLEKSGNNLSPEMRAKLENEIKIFLDKISTMGSSSSS